MLKTLTTKTFIMSLWMLCLLLASCSDSAAPVYQGSDIQIVEVDRLHDLESEFKRFSYRLDALDHGVPPIILQNLPSDFSEVVSSNKKKNIFFKSLLPMILLANAEIRQERKMVIELKKKIDQGQALDSQQRRELEILAERYQVNLEEITQQTLAELLIRVDIIPRELVLAQAANESAWGTSRFTQLANNLFGEWTFTAGTGIVPEDRPEGATYEIRRFDNIYDSIRSYLLNLNSHFAYSDLRQLRAAARFAGEPLDGSKLAEGLLRYSIRGEEYVRDLQDLIRINRLNRFASASLRTSG